MKKILLIAIASIFIFGCDHAQQHENSDQYQSDLQKKKENSIWLIYAYSYKSKALFDKNGAAISLKPIECEIIIKKVDKRSDTLIFFFEFEKKGYSYKHLYDGLALNGIKYFDSAYIPLTGMVKLDNFENLKFIKEDNVRTDIEFRTFLRNIDTTNTSKWILLEGRKRGVW